MSLIKQFYSFLKIDLSKREILIVNDYKVSYSEGGYGVIVDLFNDKLISKLEFPLEKRIDVFFLPRQSNFSLSSIAILAHEVGHVYFNTQKNIQSEIIKEIIQELRKDNKITDLFNNPIEKLKRTSISSHIEEFFCDNIGSYLLGPIFNFAFIKILGISDDDELTYSQGTHQPVFKRLYNAKNKFNEFLLKLTSENEIFNAINKIKDRYFDDIHLIPPIGDIDEEEKYFIDLSN